MPSAKVRAWCGGFDDGVPAGEINGSEEKRRNRPPQRLETEEPRKVEELADCWSVVFGVMAPEEATGEGDPDRGVWESVGLLPR